MAERSYALLEDRGFIAVEGEDAHSFLQGLISNDIEKAGAGRAIHAAFLTPQGKYLHDFFVVKMGEAFYLDCEAARLDDLKRRLSMYRLRAKVTLDDVSDAFTAAALFGEDAGAAFDLGTEPGTALPFAGGVIYVDPRLATAGMRTMLPAAGARQALADVGFEDAGREAYDDFRLRLGLPDGSRDMVVEKALLLESGFEELNGVDFEKGCYMGQELTARTKHRGLVKKRLMPVDIDGPLPALGTPILCGGKEAGEMRSSHGARGLALMRLEYLDKASGTGHDFTADGARLTPRKPGWAAF
jgi:folate-binding protein YgfZ